MNLYAAVLSTVTCNEIIIVFEVTGKSFHTIGEFLLLTLQYLWLYCYHIFLCFSGLSRLQSLLPVSVKYVNGTVDYTKQYLSSFHQSRLR